MNLSQASISDLRDEINLHTDKTGIEATYDEATKKIALSEKFAEQLRYPILILKALTELLKPEFYFKMESIDGRRQQKLSKSNC